MTESILYSTQVTESANHKELWALLDRIKPALEHYGDVCEHWVNVEFGGGGDPRETMEEEIAHAELNLLDEIYEVIQEAMEDGKGYRIGPKDEPHRTHKVISVEAGNYSHICAICGATNAGATFVWGDLVNQCMGGMGL